MHGPHFNSRLPVRTTFGSVAKVFSIVWLPERLIAHKFYQLRLSTNFTNTGATADQGVDLWLDFFEIEVARRMT